MFYFPLKLIKSPLKYLFPKFRSRKIPFCTSNNLKKILTLDERLLKYVSTLQSAQNNLKVKQNGVDSIKSDVKCDLGDLINDLCQYRGQELNRRVVEVDRKCCERLPTLHRADIFVLLNEWAVKTPYFVRNSKFFDRALKKVNFYIGALKPAEIVQLAFYSGLKKRDGSHILRSCLNKFQNKSALEQLNLDELIILINAAFKTSTRISQGDFLNEIRARLYDRLDILNNEAYFVTLIKSCRHNYNYDEEFLVTVANAMFFNKTVESYNFTALVHILALYADALYFDVNLIDNLYHYCVSNLRKVEIGNGRRHFSKNVRLKDLSRFLWSLSYLGYENLKSKDYDSLILPHLHQFTKSPMENIEDLVGIALSLWTLGFFPNELVADVLKKNLGAKSHRNAFRSRLNILLTSIKFEDPLLFDKLSVSPDPQPVFNMQVQIERREYLVRIFNALRPLLKKYKGSFCEYSYAVPHLNILGITMFDDDGKTKALIECVDETNSTKYVEIVPHGYMKLKLRLLKSLKKPLLVVDKETIEDMDESELIGYLDKKLKIAFYLSGR